MDWNYFRNHNSGKEYKKVKNNIFVDQGWLCAYCEKSIPHKKDEDSIHQRIEHFHPKNDQSDNTINWALDWNNIIGVCLGGQEEKERKQHRLPANLSCDSSKGKLIYDGYILNPLQILAFPCLFDFDKLTGELIENTDTCATEVITPNNYETTSELVRNTIKILNLNCDRLKKQRLAVLDEYYRLINHARLNQNRKILNELATKWFQVNWVSFFTVRRILLGEHAENQLRKINFEG